MISNYSSTNVRCKLFIPFDKFKNVIVDVFHEVAPIPFSNIGTFLDSESLRIAVSLRLATKIYRCYPCRCGELADEYDVECSLSAGKFNDLIKRDLLMA